MAMIETARPAPFGAVTVFRFIGEPLSRLYAWYEERVAMVSTARELSRLSARQLDDIGLTQGDVLKYQREAGLW
ncbi:MAG: DUF1127 domain-containing protein [Pseudomonadota bacterium]